MGLVQKDALRTTLISSFGLVLGYINKGFLFLLILSTEQIGVVNLTFSLGVLFAQFSNLGVVYSIWKFFPFFKNKDKAHHGFLSFMLFIALAGALLATLVFLLFRSSIESIYVENSPMFLDYYLWIIPLGLGYLFYLVFEVYLRSLFKNVISVFALDVVLRVSVTGLLFLFWMDWISFDNFVGIHSLLFFIPPLILALYLYRLKEWYVHPKYIQISKRFQKILFHFSAFNYVNTLGRVLVNSLDVIMVAQYIGLRATGIYSTVIFLTSALQVPFKSLYRVSSPLIAEFWQKRDMIQMKKLYRQVSSVSLVVGLGLFLLVWVNIDFLFSFLKPEFGEGIAVFFFLMMGRLLDMYFGLNGAIFTTSKKYRYDMIFTLCLLVIVYVLNLYLIPLYGIKGAAISTAIAIGVYNVCRMAFVYLAYGLHPFEWQQGVIIAIGTSVGVLFNQFELFEQLSWLNLIIKSGLVALLFLVPIVVFGLSRDLNSYLKNGIQFLKSQA